MGLLNINVHYYSALELTPVEACKHVKGKMKKPKLNYNYHYQEEVLGITNRKWWTVSCGPPKAH